VPDRVEVRPRYVVPRRGDVACPCASSSPPGLRAFCRLWLLPDPPIHGVRNGAVDEFQAASPKHVADTTIAPQEEETKSSDVVAPIRLRTQPNRSTILPPSAPPSVAQIHRNRPACSGERSHRSRSLLPWPSDMPCAVTRAGLPVQSGRETCTRVQRNESRPRIDR
jgi:hypothetical protein